MRKVINQSPKKLEISDLKIQMQLIEQIRKLVHSLSFIENQSRVYNLVKKIIDTIISKVVEIINKHVIDDNIKINLSKDLMDLNNDDNDNDLKSLLKQINPKRK